MVHSLFILWFFTVILVTKCHKPITFSVEAVSGIMSSSPVTLKKTSDGSIQVALVRSILEEKDVGKKHSKTSSII